MINDKIDNAHEVSLSKNDKGLVANSLFPVVPREEFHFIDMDREDYDAMGFGGSTHISRDYFKGCGGGI